MTCPIDVDAACPNCGHRNGIHQAGPISENNPITCLIWACACDRTAQQLGCECR